MQGFCPQIRLCLSSNTKCANTTGLAYSNNRENCHTALYAFTSGYFMNSLLLHYNVSKCVFCLTTT
jgi:hypothetical protein